MFGAEQGYKQLVISLDVVFKSKKVVEKKLRQELPFRSGHTSVLWLALILKCMPLASSLLSVVSARNYTQTE